MTCEHAITLMLEAEPDALAGTDHSPLATHLAGCPSCGRRARAILRAQARLGSALDARQPRQPVAEALRAAGAASRIRARPRVWWIGVPVALAAGIGGMLVLTQQDPTAPPRGDRLQTLPPFAVLGPPDATISVFTTNDPNIVVIWYF